MSTNTPPTIANHSDDPHYRDLLSLVLSEKCVAFVGSGPSSVNQIYPSWSSLVNQVRADCGLAPLRNGEETDVDRLLVGMDEAADHNEIEYCRSLKRIFGKVIAVPRIYELLINAPFLSYVTLNIDPQLAEQSRDRKNRLRHVWTFPILDFGLIDERSIYYLHGRIDKDHEPDNSRIVLGKRMFEVAYSDFGGTLSSFLKQLFVLRSVVFIGCSLREPALRQVLETCRLVREKHQPNRPVHRYALFAKRFKVNPDQLEGTRQTRDVEKEREEDAELLKLGITVVRYDSRDNDHSGLNDILEEWCRLPPIPEEMGFGPRPLPGEPT